ncbi:MAG: hypothetical protein ACRD3K_09650 [Edaphobacter sp.]
MSRFCFLTLWSLSMLCSFRTSKPFSRSKREQTKTFDIALERLRSLFRTAYLEVLPDAIDKPLQVSVIAKQFIDSFLSLVVVARLKPYL